MYNGPLDIISRVGLEGIGLFYSLYHGRVVSHKDVMENNSIMVEIQWPGLIHNRKNMVVSALPFNQGGLDGDGIKYLPPEVGDSVLVVFINADPNQALYLRYAWPSRACPPPLMGPQKAGFITPNGNKVVIDEEDNSLTVEFSGDVIIKSASSITLESPHTTIGGDVIKIGNNEDSQPGILINELTSRLNKMVQEIEQLKAQINTHVHNSAQGPTTPPSVPLTTPITPFVDEDYSNPNQLF